MQFLRRSPHGFAIVVAAVVCFAAVVGSITAGVPLQDPEGFLGPAYVRLPLLALMFFGFGILVAAAIQSRGNLRRLPRVVVDVIKTEWTWRRLAHVAAGLLVFYLCYVSYRNLKNVLPIYRDDVLYDHELFQLDAWFFGGNAPAALLHDLLGTHVTAYILSFVYVAYLPLVPVSLGLILVLHRETRVGAWYATTLSLNWVLGVVSYYLLPAVGPIYSRPGLFVWLPDTEVADLQQALLMNRWEFLQDPATSDTIHGVAAFASLHVSVTFAAALFVHRMGYHRVLRWATWTFFGLTFLATLYFGWHYVSDNLAGMLIGYLSVVLGAWASGINWQEDRTSPTRTHEAPGGGGVQPASSSVTLSSR